MNESLNPVISSKKSSKRCESRKSPAIERYDNTAPALMRLSGNKAEWIMKVRAKESSSFPLKTVFNKRKINALRSEALKPDRNVKKNSGKRTIISALFLPAKNAMKGRSKDYIMLKCIPESAKT